MCLFYLSFHFVQLFITFPFGRQPVLVSQKETALSLVHPLCNQIKAQKERTNYMNPIFLGSVIFPTLLTKIPEAQGLQQATALS